MPENPITNDEVLYRRVPLDKRLLKVQPDGTKRISSQVFYEPGHRPSVDRAKLRENEPRRTLGSLHGGIVSVITHDIRSINDLIQYDKGNHPIKTFVVDVEPKPIFNDPNEPDNPAHAEIYMDSECSGKVFQRLCEKLALLANARNWEIPLPIE